MQDKIYSSDARAWVSYHVDLSFSALLGEEDRTLGPFGSRKDAVAAGKAATDSYPASHAGFKVHRYETPVRDQEQIVSDMEMDRIAAKDGYNPSR